MGGYWSVAESFAATVMKSTFRVAATGAGRASIWYALASSRSMVRNWDRRPAAAILDALGRK